MSRPRGVIAAVVLTVAVAAGALTMCGGDDPEGGAGANPTSGPKATGPADGRSPLRKEGDALAADVFAKGAAPLGVGQAEGTIDAYGGAQPAVAEVLAVELEPAGMRLVWRLKSTGPMVDLKAFSLSPPDHPLESATDVSVVDPAGKERAYPFQFRSGQFGPRCVCSETPDKVDGTGQKMTGLYPLFSNAPTEVEVHIPGFPPITGVPVTKP